MPCSAPFQWDGTTNVLQVRDGQLLHGSDVGAAGFGLEPIAGPSGGKAGPVITIPNQTPQFAVSATTLQVIVEDSTEKPWYFVQAVNSPVWSAQGL